MMLRKAAPWIIIGLVLLMIWRNPVGTAHVFKSLGNGLLDVGTALGTFFTNLVS